MFINKYLLRFAKGSGKRVCIACLYELILTLLGTGISLCCAFAVRMILGEQKIFCFTRYFQPFFCVAAGLIIRYLLSRKKVIAATACSNQIKGRLRNSLMEKLLVLGPAYMAHSRTGDIADLISNKVEWLSYYYIQYLPTAVSSIINALLLLAVLVTLDGLTAMVCLIACIGMLGCPMLFYGLMKERGQKEWEAHTAYYSDCLDSIQGMTSLKALNANRQRRDYIHEKGEELRKTIMAHMRITMLENGTLEFLARLGSAFSVAVAVVHAIGGGSSPANLVYVLFLTSACFTPMMNLVNAWHMGYRGVTAAYTIRELLEEKAVFSICVKDGETPEAAPEGHGGICFRDVSFAYNETDGDVLHQVSFTVPEQTTTALVGPSGGGKSTIAHLLAGFYPVRAGSIQAGGLEVNEENAAAVRRKISAVWQDSHMFYGT